MAVFRVERNKGYTVMSNHHLRNKELSLGYIPSVQATALISKYSRKPGCKYKASVIQGSTSLHHVLFVSESNRC